MFCFFTILLILYVIWDVNYFLRCVFTLGFAHFFQKKRQLNEKSTIYSKKIINQPCIPSCQIFNFLGICTSQDVDIFIRHMNNARYLRELDFARFHFYGLTGIYGEIKKSHGGAVQVCKVEWKLHKNEDFFVFLGLIVDSLP